MKNKLLLVASCALAFVSKPGFALTNGCVSCGANSISAGNSYSIALLSDSTVRTWGTNWPFPALSANVGGSLTPATVVDSTGAVLTNVTAVSGGGGTVVALMSDTTLKVWGENSHYQCGLGDQWDRTNAVSIPSISNVTAIASGLNHSLAISNGFVYGWGDNSDGALPSSHTTPTLLSGLSNVTAVACGNQFSLALLSDGTVYGWGQNAHGNLGTGTTSYSSTNVPQQALLSNIVGVACGAQHGLAISNGGFVYAWGLDQYGQVGCGSNTTVAKPTPTLVLDSATYLVTNVVVTTNVDDEFTTNIIVNVIGLQSFTNSSSSNGTNTHTDTTCVTNDYITTNITWVLTNHCVDIVYTTNVVLKSMQGNVIQVTAGERVSLALTSDGRVWSWGDNSLGQLGTGGSPGNSSSPKAVLNAAGTAPLTNVVAIAASDSNHCMALLGDGTIMTWGYNPAGQLGDGTTTSRSLPVVTSN